MLKRENFTEKHIRQLQNFSRKDPILLERTIYAFGLLEAIVRVGLPFVFKGGTCLMLLLDHPRRLSTDIDIIVAPGTNVEAYINEAAKIFPFIRCQEQIRKGNNNIEKRHFKFTYYSPVNGKEFYILLDVLYEKCNYEKIIEKEIKNELLLVDSNILKVRIPSVYCILGDKLTAFAPHTIGIPLGIGKNMEIMKQLYDVSILIDNLNNFATVKNTYIKVANSEIAYRGISVSYKECLKDTFDAALSIISRGKYKEDDYRAYVVGIRDLRGHIYSESYSPEIAVGKAAKVAYITMCLLKDEPFKVVEDYRLYINEKISNEKLMILKYLKKINPETYAYVIKVDRML